MKVFVGTEDLGRMWRAKWLVSWLSLLGLQFEDLTGLRSSNILYQIKLPSISGILEDSEQESQRRTREVEALEQQLSKAAADTWRDLLT